MENKKELLTEILKRVQKNYVRVVELERLTKEMGTALSRNDQESAQLLVKMRQEEMDQISENKQEIRMLLMTLDTAERDRLKGWLEGRSGEEPDSFETKKIAELSSQLTQVLNRTISIDQVINKKLAGKDSYYQS